MVVTNAYGTATSSVALLYLNAPLRFTNSVISGGHFSALLLGSAHTNYVIESSTALFVDPAANQQFPSGHHQFH